MSEEYMKGQIPGGEQSLHTDFTSQKTSAPSDILRGDRIASSLDASVNVVDGPPSSGELPRVELSREIPLSEIRQPYDRLFEAGRNMRNIGQTTYGNVDVSQATGARVDTVVDTGRMEIQQKLVIETADGDRVLHDHSYGYDSSPSRSADVHSGGDLDAAEAHVHPDADSRIRALYQEGVLPEKEADILCKAESDGLATTADGSRSWNGQRIILEDGSAHVVGDASGTLEAGDHFAKPESFIIDSSQTPLASPLESADLRTLSPSDSLYRQEYTVFTDNGYRIHGEVTLGQDLQVHASGFDGLDPAAVNSNDSISRCMSAFRNKADSIRRFAVSMDKLPGDATPIETRKFISSPEGRDFLSFSETLTPDARAELMELADSYRGGRLHFTPEAAQLIEAGDSKGLMEFMEEGGSVLEQGIHFQAAPDLSHLRDVLEAVNGFSPSSFFSTFFGNLGTAFLANPLLVCGSIGMGLGILAVYYEHHKNDALEPQVKLNNYQMAPLAWDSTSRYSTFDGRPVKSDGNDTKKAPPSDEGNRKQKKAKSEEKGKGKDSDDPEIVRYFKEHAAKAVEVKKLDGSENRFMALHVPQEDVPLHGYKNEELKNIDYIVCEKDASGNLLFSNKVKWYGKEKYELSFGPFPLEEEKRKEKEGKTAEEHDRDDAPGGKASAENRTAGATPVAGETEERGSEAPEKGVENDGKEFESETDIRSEEASPEPEAVNGEPVHEAEETSLAPDRGELTDTEDIPAAPEETRNEDIAKDVSEKPVPEDMPQKQEGQEPAEPEQKAMDELSRFVKSRSADDWTPCVHSGSDEPYVMTRIPEGMSLRDSNGILHAAGDVVLSPAATPDGRGRLSPALDGGAARIIAADVYGSNYLHLYGNADAYLKSRNHTMTPVNGGTNIVCRIDADAAILSPDGRIIRGTAIDKEGAYIVSGIRSRKPDQSVEYGGYRAMDAVQIQNVFKHDEVVKRLCSGRDLNDLHSFQNPKDLLGSTAPEDWRALSDGRYAYRVPDGYEVTIPRGKGTQRFHAGDYILLDGDPASYGSERHPRMNSFSGLRDHEYEARYASDTVEIARAKAEHGEDVFRASDGTMFLGSPSVLSARSKHQNRIEKGEVVDSRRAPASLGGKDERPKTFTYEIDKANGSLILHGAIDRRAVNAALEAAKECGEPITDIVIASDVRAMTGDAFVSMERLVEGANISARNLVINSSYISVVSPLKDKDNHTLSPLGAIPGVENLCMSRGADVFHYYNGIENGRPRPGNPLNVPIVVKTGELKTVNIEGAEAVPENLLRGASPAVLRIVGLDGIPVDIHNNALRCDGGLYGNENASLDPDDHKSSRRRHSLSEDEIRNVTDMWRKHAVMELERLEPDSGPVPLPRNAELLIRSIAISRVSDEYFSSQAFQDDWRRYQDNAVEFLVNREEDPEKGIRVNNELYQKVQRLLQEKVKGNTGWDFGDWFRSEEYAHFVETDVQAFNAMRRKAEENEPGVPLPETKEYKNQVARLLYSVANSEAPELRDRILETCSRALALSEAEHGFAQRISSREFDEAVASMRDEIIENTPVLKEIRDLYSSAFEGQKRQFFGQEMLDPDDEAKGARTEITLLEDARRRIEAIDALDRDEVLKAQKEGRTWTDVDLSAANVGAFAFTGQNLYMSKDPGLSLVEAEKSAKLEACLIELGERTSPQFSEYVRSFVKEKAEKDPRLLTELAVFDPKRSVNENVEHISDLLVRGGFRPDDLGWPTATAGCEEMIRKYLLPDERALNSFQNVVTDQIAISSIGRGNAISRAYGTVTGMGAFMNVDGLDTVLSCGERRDNASLVRKYEEKMQELDAGIAEKKSLIEKSRSDDEKEKLSKEVKAAEKEKEKYQKLSGQLSEGWPLTSASAYAGNSVRLYELANDKVDTKHILKGNRGKALNKKLGNPATALDRTRRTKKVLKRIGLSVGHGASVVGKGAVKSIGGFMSAFKEANWKDGILTLAASLFIIPALLMRGLLKMALKAPGLRGTFKSQTEKDVDAAMKAFREAAGNLPAEFPAELRELEAFRLDSENGRLVIDKDFCGDKGIDEARRKDLEDRLNKALFNGRLEEKDFMMMKDKEVEKEAAGIIERIREMKETGHSWQNELTKANKARSAGDSGRSDR